MTTIGKNIDSSATRQMPVDSKILDLMISNAHEKKSKFAVDRKIDPTYGTCEVLVVESPDRLNRVLEKNVTNMKRILDRTQSVEILETLVKRTDAPKEAEKENETIRTAREALRTELGAFLNRIRPKEAKK